MVLPWQGFISREVSNLCNSRRNELTLGGLVTFFGEKIPSGLKLEKQIALGKWVVLVGNVGTTRSEEDSSYEGNLELRLREADFPIGQNQPHMGVSLKNSKDDLTVTANLRHQVSVGRQTKVTTFVSLDSKRTGCFTVRTNSSDQLQIAVMALLLLAMWCQPTWRFFDQRKELILIFRIRLF